MKNKFDEDFFECRDTWWSIEEQIEKHVGRDVVQELNHIMELSLYNQRDMLIEIDKLKAEIEGNKRHQLQKIIEEPKKKR